MIGATPTHGNGFRGLQLYLFHGRGKEEPEHRVLWSAMRNLVNEDPRKVPNEMRAVASQNPRVSKPVYHLSLNAAPGEELDREQWEAVADRVLSELGLSGHQAMIVAHGDTGHEHIHLMVNRVHPVTHRAWKAYRDWPKIEAALRRLEREMGLREVPGHHFQLEGQEAPERSIGVTSGEWRERERTGEEPWALRMRFRLYRHFRDASSWGDLEGRLAKEGVHLRARRRGLVVTDGERQVKASRIHRQGSKKALGERFGLAYEDWQRQIGELRRAVDHHRGLEAWEGRIEAERSELDREQWRAGQTLGPLEELRSGIEQDRDRLARQLASLYGPRAEVARARLERTVDERGFAATAELLRRHPGKFARPVGLNPLGEQREWALKLTDPAARVLQRLHESTLELHRQVEKAAAESARGTPAKALRRALETAYRQLLPDAEELWGHKRARGALEELRASQVGRAIRVLREHPERIAPLVAGADEKDRSRSAARLVEGLEEIRTLRRELARSIERERRHAWEKDPSAGSEPDPVTAARWRLDAAYEQLERHLAPVYPEGPLRRTLDRVPPKHTLRRLVTWPEPAEASLSEPRAAALERARPALEEVSGRARELARELGRRGRRESPRGRPSALARARRRLDAAYEELEGELRPLWRREHRQEAVRRLSRMSARQARRHLEADPGFFGPLAEGVQPREIVAGARPRLEAVELYQDDVQTLRRRTERRLWEKERAAGEPVGRPDPATRARWRLDRAYERVEGRLGPLWARQERDRALLRVRTLEPSGAERALREDPERFGALAVGRERAEEVIRAHAADFERLGELRRQMLSTFERERRRQWERDRSAGRPAAAPDELTAARWRLDRAAERLEERLSSIWSEKDRAEAVERVRGMTPREAERRLAAAPEEFGELAVGRDEARAVVASAEPDFERLRELSRQMLQTLNRQERLAWEAGQKAGQRVAGPDELTAARWRYDRAFEELERQVAPLWERGERERALRRMRVLSPHKIAESLTREPERFGAPAVSREAAGEVVGRVEESLSELENLRRELIRVASRQQRLAWQADRQAGRPVAEPDELTAVRWENDAARERLGERLRPLWQESRQQEALRQMRELSPHELAERLTLEPESFGPLAVPAERAAAAVSEEKETFERLAGMRREVLMLSERGRRLAWEAGREVGVGEPAPDRRTRARWELDRAYQRLEGQLGRAYGAADRQAVVRAVRRMRPAEALEAVADRPRELGRLASPRRARRHLHEAHRELEQIRHLSREVGQAAERQERLAWEAAREAGRPVAEPEPVQAARWQLDRAWERLEARIERIYLPGQRQGALRELRRLEPQEAKKILEKSPARLGKTRSRQILREQIPEAAQSLEHIGHLRREVFRVADRQSRLRYEKARAAGVPVPEPDELTRARWQIDVLKLRLEDQIERVFGAAETPRILKTLGQLHPRDAAALVLYRPRRLGRVPGTGHGPFASAERKAARQVLGQAAATLREIGQARGHLAKVFYRAADLGRRGLETTAQQLARQVARVPGRGLLEQKIASMARSIGYKSLALILPKPALAVVSLALRAARELVRERELERERGMELSL